MASRNDSMPVTRHSEVFLYPKSRPIHAKQCMISRTGIETVRNIAHHARNGTHQSVGVRLLFPLPLIDNRSGLIYSRLIKRHSHLTYSTNSSENVLESDMSGAGAGSAPVDAPSVDAADGGGVGELHFVAADFGGTVHPNKADGKTPTYT